MEDLYDDLVEITGEVRINDTFQYDASECLYVGALEHIGYEDPELLKASTYLRKERDRLFEEQLAYKLVASYRSVAPYDHILMMMEERSQNLGVIQIGANHYFSMSFHAAEQGKANVIFFRPMEYHGPMPELPE